MGIKLTPEPRLQKRLENPHDAHLPASRLAHGVQCAFLLLFFALLGLSVVYSLTEHWRRATFAFGISVLWLAVVRLTCDSKVLGIFAVRSRCFDVVFETILGSLMISLALSIDSLGS